MSCPPIVRLRWCLGTHRCCCLFVFRSPGANGDARSSRALRGVDPAGVRDDQESQEPLFVGVGRCARRRDLARAGIAIAIRGAFPKAQAGRRPFRGRDLRMSPEADGDHLVEKRTGFRPFRELLTRGSVQDTLAPGGLTSYGGAPRAIFNEHWRTTACSSFRASESAGNSTHTGTTGTSPPT
jgi:hypothetical protein